MKVGISGNSLVGITNAPPPGVVLPYAGSAAPSGWQLCYGQAISRTTYVNLFAVCGETFGVGDGATTFNLPDLRGRSVAGLDNMGGVSANRITNAQADALGGAMGAETHTLSIGELANHAHSYYLPAATTASAGEAGVNAGTNTATNTTGAGTGDAHNNVQPTFFLNYIIKE